MSINSMHDNYLDPDRHLWPEEPPEAYYTALAFFDADTEEEAAKTLYKDTSCGAWIEFSETGIKLGSIVEGADFGTATYSLDYADKFTEQDIWNRIEAIEKEADAIWNWANEADDSGTTPAEQGCDAPDFSAEFAHLNPDGRSA